MNESTSRAGMIVSVFVIIFIILQEYTMIFGAPWVPTPYKTIRRMLKLAKVKPGDMVYDLGCGDGRIIIEAARSFGAKATGIEVDPSRFVWTKARIFLLGLSSKARVLLGNFFNFNISDADVVTIYLLQDTNDKLINKFISELRPGTRIVSNTFTLSGLELINCDEDLNIFVYVV